jgi:hypothetical protein
MTRAFENNSGECARAFAQTYQGGRPVTAEGDTFAYPGEFEEMFDWLGLAPGPGRRPDQPVDDAAVSGFTASTYAWLGSVLAQASPRTVVMIGVRWGLRDGTGHWLSAGGHWFNGFRGDGADPMWADSQVGAIAPWPPRYLTPVTTVWAAVREAIDAPWRSL